MASSSRIDLPVEMASASTLRASALPLASSIFCCASNFTCSSLFLAAKACCSAVTFSSTALSKLSENEKFSILNSIILNPCLFSLLSKFALICSLTSCLLVISSSAVNLAVPDLIDS